MIQPEQAFLNLSDERRQEIISTTIALYAEHPYEEVTMRKLCAALKINLNTFYRYFKTKDDLYLYIYQLLDERLADILPPDWQMTDFVVDADTERAQFSEEEWQFLMRWQDVPDELLQRICFGDSYANSEKYIAKNLMRLKKEGDVRQDLDVELAANLLRMSTYIFHRYAREHHLSYEETIERKHYFYYTLLNYGIRGK